MSAFVAGVQNSQEIAHQKELVDSKDAAENLARTMQGLDEGLGSLLLQLLLDFTVEGRDVLDASELLREHGAALTLVDYPRMPRFEKATAGCACVRLLGNRREFPSGHTGPKKDRNEDLRWWSGVVDQFLAEGRAVFAYANYHYQNHSPSTIEQFLEISRGTRGR